MYVCVKTERKSPLQFVIGNFKVVTDCDLSAFVFMLLDFYIVYVSLYYLEIWLQVGLLGLVFNKIQQRKILLPFSCGKIN